VLIRGGKFEANKKHNEFLQTSARHLFFRCRTPGIVKRWHILIQLEIEITGVSTAAF